MNIETFTTQQASDIFGMSQATTRRLVTSGALAKVKSKISDHGQYKIPSESIIDFVTNQQICIISITPKLAKVFLAKNNPINRPIRQGSVNVLIEEIKEHGWNLNGETIKFHKDGSLIDGQHRLTAIVQSGVSIKSSIFSGADDDALIKIDTGKARTAADILAMMGYSYPAIRAGGLRLICLYSRRFKGHRNRFTPSQIIALQNEHNLNEESPVLGKSLTRLLPPTMACALHHLFSEKDPQAATEFMESLKDGTGLVANSPIYVLREKLIRISKDRNIQHRETMFMAFCIKAWNLTRMGQKCSLIVWRGKIAKQGKLEAFPAII